MAHLVKGQQCKDGDLHLDPQHPHRSDVVAHVYPQHWKAVVLERDGSLKPPGQLV